ncbi:MAG TPA: PqqD family protein [Thermoanaerobaculia bacterium]|nr:PqqD family protein [Thermoanaerobaculia bacterium]
MDVDRGNPKRIEKLIINDDDRQAPVLLNPTTGQMLITNPVGKRIVELADGTRGLEAIAMQIVSEFRGAQIPEVRQQAEAFLAEGEKKGVVTWTGQSQS